MSKVWKILIADDEAIIRASLREAVQEALPDSTSIIEAENGQDALSKAKENTDILLIDIRMPFLSGIELIKELQKIGSDWIIIIISGHSEFEYARQAVSLGVYEYLLKPIDQEILTTTLKKACKELERKRGNKINEKELKTELEDNISYLRNKFLSALATGALSNSEILIKINLYGITISDMAGVTFVALDTATGVWDKKETEKINSTVVKIFEEALQFAAPLYIFNYEGGIVALSYTAGGELWADVPAEISYRVERKLGMHLDVCQQILKGGAKEIGQALPLILVHVKKEAENKRDVHVRQARVYLEQNYMRKDLCLFEVADHLCISPEHLSRLMKRDLKMSFVEYLTAYRINRAKALLLNPEIRIMDVASLSGFSSQHYFSRIFHRISGNSPTEYRRTLEGRT